MRGTNIFAMIGKSIFESTAGRIRWSRNMWALIGGRWDRKRIRNSAVIGSSCVNEFGEFAQGGRVLVAKPNTKCPNPPRENEFYFDGKWHWVPAVECRKCQFHRASSRGFRFPRCTFKRSESPVVVATETLNGIASMVDTAVQDADRILRGESK